METENKQKMKTQNPMGEIEIEKMVINCGATDEKLEKSIRLLKMIAGDRKIYQISSTRRIPAFGISPGKKSGCKVTIRDKDKIIDLLKRFFAALDNELSGKKIVENHLSFGVQEYIEIPGLEYDRDIGILGFETSVVFKRKGKRVKIKKIKQGKYPKKQNVTKEEIIEFLNKHVGVEII
jgi:large subunit ribosomal protein L5